MRIDVLTIFPQFFECTKQAGAVQRAIKGGKLSLIIHDLRSFAKDGKVDDYPYGGGSGMVLKPEPIFEAVESLPPGYKILLSPQGILFEQDMAKSLSNKEHIILICGHYSGVDERVAEALVDLQISIGDYILSGGEFAAIVVIDAISRYLPGVVQDPNSLVEESFTQGLLLYPQYTRPRSYRGMDVPQILLSGDHKKISLWRRREALRRTWERRPDLLKKAILSEEDKKFLSTLGGKDDWKN